MSSSIQLTTQLKNTNISGRIVADFVNQTKNSTILVQNGDKITIPEYTNQVYVYGEVNSEGSTVFIEKKDVLFYLLKKGGLSDAADKDNIYVLQPNGETQKFTFNKNVFKNRSKDIEIYSGSIIFVPRKLDDTYSLRMRTQAYVSILGNLGISLASLSVLKD